MDGELRTYTLEAAEIRAEGAGGRQRLRFTGYALTFDRLSHELYSFDSDQPFRERILPGAAKETIAQDDIRFVLNHDPYELLGRTASRTLRLAEDSRGVHVDAHLPDTSYARDYAELVERGDANEMSFRFYDSRDRWTNENGQRVRDLISFRLRDVAALTVPAAYPGTSVSVAARALAHAEEELRAGKVLSAENVAALEQLIADVRAILDKTGAAASPRSLAIMRRRLELRMRGA